MRKILSSSVALSALLLTATGLHAQTAAPNADELLRRQQQGQGAVQGGAQGSGSATTPNATIQGSGAAQGSGSAQTGTAPSSGGTSAQGSGSTSGGAATGAAQGGGATNAGANITAEQRTTIRQAITTAKVEPAREVNFSVSVGVAIPRTVALYPLPPRVVEIVPAYRAYRYFLLADGRIVIVDPDSLRIVAILAA